MEWPLGEENTMILTGCNPKHQFYLKPTPGRVTIR